MEEILIVDRIENGYAVCETEQGEKKDIPLSETKDVHEGDVLILKDGVYIPDKDKTEARRKKDTRPTGGSVGLRQHRMMRYA